MTDNTEKLPPNDTLCINQPGESIKFAAPTDTLVTFNNHDAEVLRITKDAFIYKGQRIEDAGGAHRAFLEAMNVMVDGRSVLSEEYKQLMYERNLLKWRLNYVTENADDPTCFRFGLLASDQEIEHMIEMEEKHY